MKIDFRKARIDMSADKESRLLGRELKTCLREKRRETERLLSMGEFQSSYQAIIF